MNAAPIRIVVIDDHEVLRAGLRVVFPQNEIAVVADTGLGADAPEIVREHKPDVVVVDVNLTDMDGVDLIKQLAAERVKVVVYSGFHSDRLLARALGAGAAGYVLKDGPLEELSLGIVAVANRKTWIGTSVRERMAGEPPRLRLPLLSRREREILDLISQGRSTDEVADDLSLSAHTVRTHVKNAMRKLEATTRAHAVAIAMRELSIQ